MSEKHEEKVIIPCENCGGTFFHVYPDFRKNGLIFQCIEDGYMMYRVIRAMKRVGALFIPMKNRVLCPRCGEDRFAICVLEEPGGTRLVCTAENEEIGLGDAVYLRWDRR